jgi:hypothetical protein
MSAPFGIEETARRIGHYQWVEQQLFETLGAWVPAVPELDAKVLLATHGHHHAWHAELWRRRLPELRDLPVDRVVVPAKGELRAFVDAMAEPAAPELTIEKLVGVYRVLVPALVAAYTFHLNHTSSVADGPMLRSLRFVLQDEIDDWREGEVVIQVLMSNDTVIERAAAHESRLRKLLRAAGGIAGPMTFRNGARDS